MTDCVIVKRSLSGALRRNEHTESTGPGFESSFPTGISAAVGRSVPAELPRARRPLRPYRAHSTVALYGRNGEPILFSCPICLPNTTILVNRSTNNA